MNRRKFAGLLAAAVAAPALPLQGLAAPGNEEAAVDYAKHAIDGEWQVLRLVDYMRHPESFGYAVRVLVQPSPECLEVKQASLIVDDLGLVASDVDRRKAFSASVGEMIRGADWKSPGVDVAELEKRVRLELAAWLSAEAVEFPGNVVRVA